MAEDINICRICLNLISTNEKSFFLKLLDPKLLDCLPEIDLTIPSNPVSCAQCFDLICSLQEFKQLCLRTECFVQKLRHQSIPFKDILKHIDPKKVKLEFEENHNAIKAEVNHLEIVDDSYIDFNTGIQLDSIKDNTIYNCYHCIFKSSSGTTFLTHMRLHRTKNSKPKRNVCNYSSREENQNGVKEEVNQLEIVENSYINFNTGIQLDSIKDVTIYNCNHCIFKSSIRKTFVTHLRLHRTNSSKRNICDYTTPQEENQNGVKEEVSQLEIVDNSYIDFNTGMQLDAIKHNTIYNCYHCIFKSSSRKTFLIHMRLHRTKSCFKCNVCDYITPHNFALTAHKKKHSTEKPFKCNVCNYSSSVRNTLKLHMRVHTGEKPYKCTECEYKTAHCSRFKIHQLSHSNQKLLQCNDCDYRTNRKDTLSYHVMIHKDMKPFKCTKCKFSTRARSVLKGHMEKHNEDFSQFCDVCDFKTTSKGLLKLHMRTHSNNKPYKCDKCGFATRQVSNLYSHMKTHLQVKPFKCNMCNVAYANKLSLNKHVSYVHNKIQKEKRFKCDQCKYACDSNFTLVSHVRSHTGEKPFKCNICEYRSTQMSHLRTHVRTHTGEKPFKCEKCDYKASNKSVFTSHMRTHTGEKPYKCDQCSYSCIQSQALASHKRTHSKKSIINCKNCDFKTLHNIDLKKHLLICKKLKKVGKCNR